MYRLSQAAVVVDSYYTEFLSVERYLNCSHRVLIIGVGSSRNANRRSGSFRCGGSLHRLFELVSLNCIKERFSQFGFAP